MADTLHAAPILGGYDREHGGVRLSERDDLALVSVAVPLGGEPALADALQSGFGLGLPEHRRSTAAGEYRAVRMGADQLMLIFPHAMPDAEPFVRGKLAGTGYTTDQTDAWVVLEMSGPGRRHALERVCPLDLHDTAFPPYAAARTVMDHMGALVVRTGDDTFLLASASSSARSFLHALDTSISHTR